MLRTRGAIGRGDLRWVYGAAVRAASNEEGAVAATAGAVHGRGSDSGADRRTRLMAAAVRTAVADSPCEALALLPLREREPLALARIVGMDVDEIAAVLGCDRDEVKARMRAGLERLALVSATNGAVHV